MKLLTASVALVVIIAALAVTQTEARPGEGIIDGAKKFFSFKKEKKPVVVVVKDNDRKHHHGGYYDEDSVEIVKRPYKKHSIFSGHDDHDDHEYVVRPVYVNKPSRRPSYQSEEWEEDYDHSHKRRKNSHKRRPNREDDDDEKTHYHHYIYRPQSHGGSRPWDRDHEDDRFGGDRWGHGGHRGEGDHSGEGGRWD